MQQTPPEMVKAGKPVPKAPPSMAQSRQPVPKVSPASVQPRVAANKPKRPVPLNNKPSLMPPPAPTPGSADPKSRMVNVLPKHHRPCALCAYPHFHPYPSPQKRPVQASLGEEEVNSYDTKPKNEPRSHHPFEMTFEMACKRVQNHDPPLQDPTPDRLAIYPPIPDFEIPSRRADPVYEAAWFGLREKLRQYAGPVNQRQFAGPADSGGSNSSICEALDLNLKLGFE